MLADSTPNAGRWPDLVVEHSATGSRRAIEVELTRKKDARLHDKLLAYSDSQYDSVTYLVPTAGALRHLARQVQRLRLDGLIGVELLHAFTVQADATVPPPLDALHDEVAQLRTTIARLQQAATADYHELEARQARIDELETKLTWLVRQVTIYVDAGHCKRAETRKRWRSELAGARARV